MSWDGPFWFPHRVLVKDAIASGGRGPRLGDSREIEAEVKDEQRLVRTPDGKQIVSSSTVTVPLEANVPVGSEVTVWPGSVAERTTTVLAVGRDENDPPLPSQLILSLE